MQPPNDVAPAGDFLPAEVPLFAHVNAGNNMAVVNQHDEDASSDDDETGFISMEQLPAFAAAYMA